MESDEAIFRKAHRSPDLEMYGERFLELAGNFHLVAYGLKGQIGDLGVAYARLKKLAQIRDPHECTPGTHDDGFNLLGSAGAGLRRLPGLNFGIESGELDGYALFGE